jgi:hypothetical protein
MNKFVILLARIATIIMPIISLESKGEVDKSKIVHKLDLSLEGVYPVSEEGMVDKDDMNKINKHLEIKSNGTMGIQIF